MTDIRSTALVFAAACICACATQAAPRYSGPHNPGRQDSGPPPAQESPSDQSDQSDQRDQRDQRDHNRIVFFNVFCRYGQGPQCVAGARIKKAVTADGEEVLDVSQYPDNPVFAVECEGRTLFNNVAHRFTERGGTRLQAEGGAYPAVELPPDSLEDGRRKVSSTLELLDRSLEGSCQIYTGDPTP